MKFEKGKLKRLKTQIDSGKIHQLLLSSRESNSRKKDSKKLNIYVSL